MRFVPGVANSHTSSLTHHASSLLIGASVCAVLVGLLTDLFGIGEPGLGRQQSLLAFLGGLGIVVALLISAQRREKWTRFWSSAARLRFGQLLLLATWFGLSTGLLEVMHQGWRTYGLGEFIRQPLFQSFRAFGMAVSDKFPVDPTQFKILDGRLLLFLNNRNVNARKLWNKGIRLRLHRRHDRPLLPR